MLSVGILVCNLGAVSRNGNSIGVALGLLSESVGFISSFLLSSGVDLGLSGILLSDKGLFSLVLGGGLLDSGGVMRFTGEVLSLVSSGVNLDGLLLFSLGITERVMCISKATLSSGDVILSFSDGIGGLSLSNASESTCFCCGSEDSLFVTSVGLGLFVLSSGQIVGSNGSLMFSNLALEGIVELSLSTSRSHSSSHGTEVFMGLLGSFFIKSLLFGDVSVSGGLSLIKGINVIKER